MPRSSPTETFFKLTKDLCIVLPWISATIHVRKTNGNPSRAALGDAKEGGKSDLQEKDLQNSPLS